MLDKELQERLIAEGRLFTKGDRDDDPYGSDFESDQRQRLPQPPLVKAPMASPEDRVVLPRDFDGLLLKRDLTEIIRDRRSARVYTPEHVTLDQLSYILWACQGIKGIRGKSYATLRTVPCGGARHEFETYVAVRNVEGLRCGAYHYLPTEHAIEYLGEIGDYDHTVTDVLDGQAWGAKGAFVLFWSMVPYRAEWRYGIYAHRIALIDIGHVGENVYLACTGLGLGTCGVGAFSHEASAALFDLDGENEYIVYSMPVGAVSAEDRNAEQAFYKFVEDEGL